MPTLWDYRAATLAEEGGVLGVQATTITLDPDITDRDAARSVIAARLYDDEKLSSAYSGQYVWASRWSDQRRTILRGYRVRYVAIFAPPTEGTYRLQFFGHGETESLPHSTSPLGVQQAIRRIDPEALGGVDVLKDPLGLMIDLGDRIGVGATAGRMVAPGGVGICLVNRDFTVPLKKGTVVLLSPRIPFESDDQVLGLHDCINLALADIREADLLPVVSAHSAANRPSVIRLSEVAPWLEADMVTGFFAPTNWSSVTTFRPPSSGSYLLQPVSSVDWQTIPAPLPYDATGSEIEAALRSVGGLTGLRVAPQHLAPQYDIIWETMHHQATIASSAGAIVGYTSERTREPYPTSIAPSYMGDFESDTFSDPGYGADQSWFIACRRPASTRICPQTYPRKSDGTFDTSREPIPGSYWVESVRGLQHDLDQARPPVEVVAPAALRYACLALANVAPAGEAQRWEALAQKQAMHAAAKVVYGRQHRRGYTTRGPAWPPLGEKAWGFFQP